MSALPLASAGIRSCELHFKAIC